jgi:hypothetical protein
MGRIERVGRVAPLGAREKPAGRGWWAQVKQKFPTPALDREYLEGRATPAFLPHGTVGIESLAIAKFN